VDRLEKLIGDPRDGDVRDLELLLPQEVQQEIERSGERLELDHKARARTQSAGRCLREGGGLGRGHD